MPAESLLVSEFGHDDSETTVNEYSCQREAMRTFLPPLRIAQNFYVWIAALPVSTESRLLSKIVTLDLDSQQYSPGASRSV